MPLTEYIDPPSIQLGSRCAEETDRSTIHPGAKWSTRTSRRLMRSKCGCAGDPLPKLIFARSSGVHMGCSILGRSSRQVFLSVTCIRGRAAPGIDTGAVPGPMPHAPRVTHTKTPPIPSYSTWHRSHLARLAASVTRSDLTA